MARFLALLIAATLWLPVPAGRAATSGSVDLAYDIYVGGLTAARTRVTLKSSQSYGVLFAIESQGLIGLITGYAAESRTDGSLASGAPVPQRHRTDTVWFGRKRWVELLYGSNSPREVATHPDNVEDDRTPVPPDLIAGTVDPITAALLVSRFAAADSPANSVVRVFDGRRRYDLLLDRAPEPQSIAGPFFSGTARPITVTLMRIAGESRSGWLPRPKEPEVARMFFAALPGAPDGFAVPVRVEVDTVLGAVMVHLMSFQVASNAVAPDGRHSPPLSAPVPPR